MYVFFCGFVMVHNYKRKIKRWAWSEQAMPKVIDTILQRNMWYMLAAKSFSVPQTTLERSNKGTWERQWSIEPKIPLGAKLPVFLQEEENELVNYLLGMESSFLDLWPKIWGKWCIDLLQRIISLVHLVLERLKLGITNF